MNSKNSSDVSGEDSVLWLLGEIIAETITLNSTQQSLPRKQASVPGWSGFQINDGLCICAETSCILTDVFVLLFGRGIVSNWSICVRCVVVFLEHSEELEKNPRDKC